MVDIKSTSNAVWWIKNPSQQRRHSESLGNKFAKDMTDLFRNISLHAYNKFVDSGLLSCEKFIWLCVHVTILCFMSVALTYTWDQFVLQHFSINLYDPLYPVQNVPFPAVSICSNNRISRKAALQYAQELSKLDPAKHSPDYYMERILYFNSFNYRHDRLEGHLDFREFQKFLDHYGTSDNETFYNMLKVMERLTPKCEDFILACMLGAKRVNCFEEKTFQTKLTMYGPCCMFNSNDSYRERTYRTRFSGSGMGLIVVMNTSHADDMANLLSMDGYAVIIHAPNRFPEISSGSSLEVFPNINEETFIALKARVLDGSDKLRSFAASHRKCYFDDEVPLANMLVNNKYSMSNCITRCRARSVMALCNCIPFYTPLSLVDESDGVPFCTLGNIECMQQYKFKWRNVLTEHIEFAGLERENEEALLCPQCLQSCDDIHYDISMMSLPADRVSLPKGIDVDLNISEISVLKVFFGETAVPYYKRVVTNTWVEATSTVGNIVSICMGFSMVALLEIFYFVVKYLFIALKRYVTQNAKPSKWRRRLSRLSNGNEPLYICP
ncbi:sodium channel protein Nach isoform X2 [Musca domestica]|uniref:Sodium channel protein Nach isoform X2 n=1 Tax=Musca domestica TaxID=7370 RepID=A0ABM3VFN8_MUSDO|nr:sodium channel protein Nach isoform X2 [Musca domestica]